MHPRAETLIRQLGLQPHPEGGFYREVFRSVRRVQPFDARAARSALTLIYFLLVDGGASRWHRVRSDEAWTWVEGDRLDLLALDPALTRAERTTLGPADVGVDAAAVIAAGDWQAARTTGAYTLVTCAVGPGFDFADFAMLSDDEALAGIVRSSFPDLAELI
jgi:predicted cupin superfamily sugar epimerase